MGNISSYQKVTFEDMQKIVDNNNIVIINTLDINNQSCLIKNTINASNEVELINNYIKQDKTKEIIIYGKNYYDPTIYKKYTQLKNIGFKNVKLYMGGMFEWLCLQDIYGKSLFETNGHDNDILKYK